MCRSTQLVEGRYKWWGWLCVCVIGRSWWCVRECPSGGGNSSMCRWAQLMVCERKPKWWGALLSVQMDPAGGVWEKAQVVGVTPEENPVGGVWEKAQVVGVTSEEDPVGGVWEKAQVVGVTSEEDQVGGVWEKAQVVGGTRVCVGGPSWSCVIEGPSRGGHFWGGPSWWCVREGPSDGGHLCMCRWTQLVVCERRYRWWNGVSIVRIVCICVVGDPGWVHWKQAGFVSIETGVQQIMWAEVVGEQRSWWGEWSSHSSLKLVWKSLARETSCQPSNWFMLLMLGKLSAWPDNQCLKALCVSGNNGWVNSHKRCMRWGCTAWAVKWCVRWGCTVWAGRLCVGWGCAVWAERWCVRWGCIVWVGRWCVRWGCTVWAGR